MMAITFAMPAQALDWRFEPTLGLSTTYTDNANQSATDPESAMILRATPGFTLRSQGLRRAQATLRYGLSGVARFGEDEGSDLHHNLNANGKAELVEDFLYIDGTARISQELISLTGSPGEAEINDGNRATVGTYSISPYIQKRLDTFANVQARYTAGGTFFGDDAASDSTSNALSAGISSGTRFNDLSWSLGYQIRDARNRNSEDTRFERATVQLGYALSRKFRVFGTAGKDWNEYTSLTETDGTHYSAGFGWSPTRRTSVEASAGESYYGDTYSLNLRHRTQHSAWSLGYDDGVSDISQLLTNALPITAWACTEGIFFTTTTFPPADQTNCVSLGTAEPGTVPLGIANGVFVSKTLRGTAAWTKGRNSLSLNVFDMRRQYQQVVGLPEDETRGLTAGYTYRLDAKTRARATASYTNIKVPAGLETLSDRDDDLYSLSFGVDRRFAEKIAGALIFRHTQRNSNDPGAEYEENSITASANLRF